MCQNADKFTSIIWATIRKDKIMILTIPYLPIWLTLFSSTIGFLAWARVHKRDQSKLALALAPIQK
jgi:hypothetical protein